MKVYFISDIHVDFYCPQSSNYETLLPYFEDFFKEYFLPADAVSIAGDVANDSITQIAFMRFISGKYDKVYIVFGNHDLVVRGATFGNGNPFSTSEERMEAVKAAMAAYPNVHILDGNVVDGFGGAMGMCDLTYRCSTTCMCGSLHLSWKKHWFDGRHWRYLSKTGDNDPDKIWALESGKMGSAASQSPKVMVTHFCPFEMGIGEKFKEDYGTAYFYFKGKPFLDKLQPGTIWQCGHTHDLFDTDYNGIRIICNPLGYPDERSNGFMLAKEAGKYLIDV